MGHMVRRLQVMGLNHVQLSTDPTDNAYCMELQAVQAFAFLNFLMCKFF
jgi:hypothetical protein